MVITNVTEKEPVNQVKVTIPPCQKCKGTEGTLYIDYFISYQKILGIKILASHSKKAAVHCDACGNYIKRGPWSPELRALEQSELAKVKISFWKRYGGWISILLVIAAIEVYYRIKAHYH